MNFRRILLLTTIVCAFDCELAFADRLVIYNPIEGKREPMDEVLHQQFDGKYEVVDFQRSEHMWDFDQGITHKQGSATKDGVCIAGTVVAFYIVTDEGQVEDVRVYSSTDPQLEPFARTRLSGVTHEPPRLDGHAVATATLAVAKFMCS